jgi:DNA polymerase-3 subunit delta'
VERLAAAAAESGLEEGRAGRRAAREAEEAGRRASRRARTEALDAGLGLLAAWLRDLAALADGAEELAMNADRLDDLRNDAAGLDARAARRGGELVMDARRRLQVNVGEELALEALVYRLEALLSGPRNRS